MPFIQFQFRRGLASEWASVNPVLAEGEMGIETDTDLFKIGDGTTTWNSLPYGGVQGSQGFQGVQGAQGFQGFQGAQGAQGFQGVQGAQGAQGFQGVQGEYGQSTSVFNYITDTTPSTGQPPVASIYWNNSTQISATQLSIFHIDALGIDNEFFFANLAIDQSIRIQSRVESADFQVFQLTGNPTVFNPNTPNAYITVPVTLTSSGGLGTSNFTNSLPILLQFAVKGERGFQGFQGVQGAQGFQGFQGVQGAQGAQGSPGLGVGDPQNFVTITGDYTMTNANQVVVSNATVPIVVTLPSATTAIKSYYIQNMGTSTMTLQTVGGEFINSNTLLILAFTGSSCRLMSDGVRYSIF